MINTPFNGSSNKIYQHKFHKHIGKVNTWRTFAPAWISFSTQEIFPCIAANINGV